MIRHFTEIQTAGGLFDRKCGICHPRAVDLARIHLTNRNEKLTGLYTGCDMPEFFILHGRLTAPEVNTVLRMIERP